MKAYLIILVIATPLACAAPSGVAMDPVSLDVRFKLTDLDYKPIPDALVRLTFGSDLGGSTPRTCADSPAAIR